MKLITGAELMETFGSLKRLTDLIADMECKHSDERVVGVAGWCPSCGAFRDDEQRMWRFPSRRREEAMTHRSEN